MTVDNNVPAHGGRLLVVGAGIMGRQIALQAALQRIEVGLVDVSAEQIERARAAMAALIERRTRSGKLTAEEGQQVLARVRSTTDLAGAATGARWAIEAVVERLEVKRAVFEELAALLPGDVGLATNSSHIRAAVIAGDAPWAARVMNMHFFHPVLVMDLVEIVSSPVTDPALLEAATGWAQRIGRTPVVLRMDLDGFLVNRILGAASREAFSLLSRGAASFADIDIAVRRGLRWPLGPFELADLSGLDVLLHSRTRRYEELGDADDLATVEVLRPLVEAGRLGRKSGAGFYDYGGDTPSALPLPSGARLGAPGR